MKSTAENSSVISTTVPYCDRYNFLCQTSALSRSSAPSLPLSSSQSASLSTAKLQPPASKTPAMKLSLPSLDSTADAVTSNAVSPVICNSGTSVAAADSLWRSSFVCISSTSHSDGTNKTRWGSSDSVSERFSPDKTSVSRVFLSTTNSLSSDENEHLSKVTKHSEKVGFLDKPPGLAQRTSSLQSPVSSEHGIKSGSFASSTCDTSDRRVPATLNGRMQSSSPTKNHTPDNEQAPPLVSQARIKKSSEKLLHSQDTGTPLPSKHLSKGARTSQDVSMQNRASTDKTTSGVKVKHDKVAVAASKAVANRRPSEDRLPSDDKVQRVNEQQRLPDSPERSSAPSQPVTSSDPPWLTAWMASANERQSKDELNSASKIRTQSKDELVSVPKAGKQRKDDSVSAPKIRRQSKDEPVATHKSRKQSTASSVERVHTSGGGSRTNDERNRTSSLSVSSDGRSPVSSSKVIDSKPQQSSTSSTNKIVKGASSQFDSSSSRRQSIVCFCVFFHLIMCHCLDDK